MKNFWLLSLLLLWGCSSQPFKVSQYHMRGESMLNSSADMVKAEARFRLDHNISKADRKQKRGHYYVFQWDRDLLISETSPVEVSLEYRQSRTGRVSKKKTATASPQGKNKAEIIIIGDDYLKNGRVLSWKATLSQQGKVLGTEESFMWE